MFQNYIFIQIWLNLNISDFKLKGFMIVLCLLINWSFNFTWQNKNLGLDLDFN